jgi:hypothetical protein
LEGAGAEPDSYHTPRIAGLITFQSRQPSWFIGIKAYGALAKSWQLDPAPGKMTGIATYKGSMESPEATNPDFALPMLDIKANTAGELGKYILDISAASSKGNDIRVCAIGGVYTVLGGWKLFIHNSQK